MAANLNSSVKEIVTPSWSANRHDKSMVTEILAGVKKTHYEVVHGVSSVSVNEYVCENQEVEKMV
jgi:hypothetical protein